MAVFFCEATAKFNHCVKSLMTKHMRLAIQEWPREGSQRPSTDFRIQRGAGESCTCDTCVANKTELKSATRITHPSPTTKNGQSPHHLHHHLDHPPPDTCPAPHNTQPSPPLPPLRHAYLSLFPTLLAPSPLLPTPILISVQNKSQPPPSHHDPRHSSIPPVLPDLALHAPLRCLLQTR